MADGEAPKKMKKPRWLEEAQQDSDVSTGKDEGRTATLKGPAHEEPGFPTGTSAAASPKKMSHVPQGDAETSSPTRPPESGKPGNLRGALGGLFPGKGSRAARRQRMVALALAAAALFIIVVFGLRIFAGGGEPADQSGAGPGRQGGAASSAQAAGAVRETDISFGRLEKEDGAATLEGAGLSWEGEAQSGEAGETVTLRGPTAAQIRRGFELPGSSVESGVYAVAQDEGPVLHVVYSTYQAGEAEVTQGSIFAIEDDLLKQSGFYRDERERATDTVVRTYLPPGGENYRVSFEAPPGTPVPLLVGYRGLP